MNAAGWLVAILTLLGLSMLGLRWWYRRWLHAQRTLASADSQIVQLRSGPVEYGVRGEG